MIQGASIRRLSDVPEMETLQMRWLSIVTPLDMFGTDFRGQYWAITNIPAYNNADNQHLPLPPASQAIMAVQPIEVLQIQLPEPIDTVENESASAERAMHEAGYTGNTDRQAIPVIVVRYATSLPGLGKVEVCTTCLSDATRPSPACSLELSRTLGPSSPSRCQPRPPTNHTSRLLSMPSFRAFCEIAGQC